jgi:RNA polymerase sigma factor (sigma-70 family)
VNSDDERYLRQALQFEGVLRACLYRYTRNESDVDELLQETYVRLLTAGSCDAPEVRSVRAFALTIARNVAFDWLRHKRVVPIDLIADLEALDVLDEGEQIEEIVNGHQELQILVEALRLLPAQTRRVFPLRKVYGYSHREIATRLVLSVDSVNEHLAKAAKRVANAPEKNSLPQRKLTFRRLFTRKKVTWT